MRSFPFLGTATVALALSASGLFPRSEAVAQNLPDVSGYPRPVPLLTVQRAPNLPRLQVDPTAVEFREAKTNQAIRVQVLGAAFQSELFGEVAPEGQVFLILATHWQNIHPKQLVDRASLEGRSNRTMGVGTLAGGGGPPPEYVEADVAYQVPRLSDHIFALVDGEAVSLHSATATLPGGRDPDGDLTLPSLGSESAFPLAFLVPDEPRDVALQFFDYSYGNIVAPVRGEAPRAANVAEEAAAGEVLDRVETEDLEIAATGLTFRDRYDGQEAPAGWRFAVVALRGRSLSASGEVGNIIQLNPLEYAFLTTDGGFINYSVGGSVNEAGMIRFTPEIPQRQELAFLVGEEEERMTLGLRLRNEVVTLDLTDDSPDGFPRRGEAGHEDGDVLEVLLFGSRREGDTWIVDLGVRPLAETRGLEIQARAQFLLVLDGSEIPPDLDASRRRVGRPPEPFVVPPGVPIRFELVFPAAGDAEGIRYRGFRSEGILRF